MERALPVLDYVAFDSSVEDTGDLSNMTAEQYLSWVRYQANELPDVFTADVDSSLYAGRQTKYMPEIEDVLVCPEHLLPSLEWESDVISAFSDLRALLARLSLSEASRERKLVVPQLKDENAWLRFCLGSEYSAEENGCPDIKANSGNCNEMDIETLASSDLDFEQRKLELSKSLEVPARTDDENVEEPNDSDDEGNTDNLHGSSTRRGADGNYAVWSGAEDSLPTTSLLLQFDQVMTQRLLGYQVSWLEGRESISSARGQWLYGLLARLEKPLDRTMASLLRELYRRASQLRAALLEDDDNFDVQIASLNVLIVITGSYFGQGEEYSTLRRGYDDEDDEGDDADGEDDDFYEDDDNGHYYIEGQMETLQGTLPGGYSIGDDIWSDRAAMTIEEEFVSAGDNEENHSRSYLSSYLKKRTAEGSAEEGEELEDGEE